MLWILLAACQPAPDLSPDEAETSAGIPQAATIPTSIDFGEVAPGSEQVLSLLLQNLGDADYDILNATLSSPDITLTLPTDDTVTPELGLQILLSWSPSGPGELEDALVISTSDPATPTLTVPIIGTSNGPVLTTSTTEADLGVVGVGCTEEIDLSISNSGNQDLQITDLSQTNTIGEFTLSDLDGEELAPLPWTLEPFETTWIKLQFAPTYAHDTATIIQIDSNDLSSPVSQVQIYGEGSIEGEQTDIFEVTGQQKVVGLFAVNDECCAVSTGMFHDTLTNTISELFDALLESRVDYRIASLLTSDGKVGGSTPYIDDTYSASEAGSIFMEMIDGGSVGDNDQNLTTLYNGVVENADWLFADGWEDAKLNMVAINYDQEQSSLSYSYYLKQIYSSYQPDTDSVVYHAIGGPTTTGTTSCGVQTFDGMDLAVSATGGVFLDICEDEWEGLMAQLANAMLGGFNTFNLTKTPSPSSIEVYIDGVLQSSGWSYNADFNSIDFTEEAFPADDTELKVYYLLYGECDE